MFMLIFGIILLLVFPYFLIRIEFVFRLKSDLIKFCFNAPGAWVGITKGDVLWRKRTRWLNEHLADSGIMVWQFWVWPLKKYVKGEFADSYFHWERMGRPQDQVTVIEQVEIERNKRFYTMKLKKYDEDLSKT